MLGAGVVVLCLCLAPGAAWSDIGDDPPSDGIVDERLPAEQLLDQLAEAESEAEAQRLERLIIQAWQQSGSATIDLLMQRANEALQEEEFGLALEYLDTVVELAPEFAEGWNMRATLYFRINEFQRSIDDIGRVLALQPRHFGALSGLGVIFRELDDKPRALSALRRALEVHPYFGDIRRTVDRLEIEVEGRGI
jgi:tetratricopeptide (TPR) repeat protein